jgi:hypothetical protein
MPSSGGTAHHRSSGGSGSPWSQTRSMEEELSDPISPTPATPRLQNPSMPKKDRIPPGTLTEITTPVVE